MRKKDDSKAFRVALGGICSAVCLLMMFMSGFLPMLNYTIPTFAGFLMVVMIIEADKTWAISTYAAVSLLCIFITPNYEASLLFILFMGYYPILKFHLDKNCGKPVALLVKFGVFNIAIMVYYKLFKAILTSEEMLDGLEMFGKYAIVVLWAMAQVCFVLYDYALNVLTDVYINWFRKSILRRK
ncbi:MAG: hypothetical protein IJ129_01555 [Ruminococcus sp.]|nr:hypothetical protein [Ruminococcus sp.]